MHLLDIVSPQFQASYAVCRQLLFSLSSSNFVFSQQQVAEGKRDMLVFLLCLHCYSRFPLHPPQFLYNLWGWWGVAKVLCILCQGGIQLILQLGERNVFISSVSSFSFLFLFLPCPPLSSPLLFLLSLLSLSLGDDSK